MASSSFSDAPNPDSLDPESKSVTIVINDNGEINYDERTLQSIIDSNQPSATVTFVRVSGNDADVSLGGDPTLDQSSDLDPKSAVVPANPILMLDQEQINRLENVLRSEEAKDFLGEVLANPDNDPNESLGDILSTSCTSDIDAIGPPPPLIPNPDVNNKKGGKKGKNQTASNRRKSQRQIDRELKEEAERIRKENQELLKKEKEAMRRQSMGDEQASNEAVVVDIDQLEIEAKPAASSTPTVASGRPKRERKLPAHLKAGDFEYSYIGPNDSMAKKKAAAEEAKKAAATAAQLSESGAQDDSKADLDQIEDEFMNESEEQQEERTQPDLDVEEGSPADAGENDDDDDDDDYEEADDDDDPNKLWCICQQPHNNRFMICCDQCLDWFHGKCVGITKKMGKEMEEAGNEWTCPKCKSNEQKEEAQLLKEKLKEREEKVNKAKISPSAPPKKKTSLPKRAPSKEPPTKKEQKKKTCYVCERAPKEGSIFCSDSCIIKHANKAIEMLKKDKPKTGLSTAAMMMKSHVLVMEPQTNTMLNGPNAPTENTLQSWLLSHPSYHVVLPSNDPSSKFYGTNTSKFYGSSKKVAKKTPTKHEGATKVNSEKVKAALLHSISSPSKIEVKKPTPSGISTTSKITVTSASVEKKPDKKEDKPVIKRSTSSHDQGRSRKSSGYSSIVVHSSSSQNKRDSTRRDSFSSTNTTPTSASKKSAKEESKPIRDNAAKGLREALKSKLAKNEDVKLEGDKLEDLVRSIERELYILHSRNVCAKYKAKYRSLVFNIKDEKNNGLFRKIISGHITPKNLVAMSPEELANKELKEWRQAELKQDIEKIKSHELELLQMGSKMMIKTHKGDQIVEAPHAISKTESVIKLPDEIVNESSKPKSVKISSKTWDHSKHDFDKECDVCAGKMTEDAYLIAKIEREKRHEKDKHRHHRSHKSSSHKSSSSDKHRHHSSSRHSSSSSSSSKRHRHGHHRDDSKDEVKKEETKAEALPIVRPEDIEKKVEEILASTGKVLEASIEAKDEVVEVVEDANEPVDIDIPGLKEEEEEEDDKKDINEVTSTVTIKTPEEERESIKNANPSVWNGEIDMPEVAKFNVKALQVSGSTDYITVDLKETLKIVGRIPPTVVWDYIRQVSDTKEILLISLMPASKDEKMSYMSFFHYLKTRDRFGVVGNTSKMVKDCYILALPKTQQIHPCLLPLDGPGLDPDRGDVLLALIVRSKRKRDHASRPVASSSKKSKKSIAITDDDIKNMLDMSGKKYTPTPVVKKAKSSSTSPDDDPDEIYDPESAFEPKKPKKRKKSSVNLDEPSFSSSESPSPPPPKIPMTKSEGGFTDDLAKLTKKIEEQKKELSAAKKDIIQPVFKGLPSGIANILFGGSESTPAPKVEPKVEPSRDPRKKPTVAIPEQPPKSLLSTLSDADLLAKAEAEMKAQGQPKPKPATAAPAAPTSGAVPWIQGFEPKNQPPMPWPTTGKTTEAHQGRRDSRDRDRDSRDRDRNSRDRTSRDRDRDYHRRDSRDRDRDYRGHRGHRYHDRGYDRRDRDRNRDSDRHRDRDRRSKDDRESSSNEARRRSPEREKAKSPPPSKVEEEVKKTDEGLVEEKHSDFLPLFSIAAGEPKPPGDDDIVPF